MRTWVLIADRARARLFEARQGNGHLDEVAGFIHVEGQLGSELDRDQQGPQPRDKVAREFAHGLATVLDQGRLDHCYERLILVAPPRFLGQLRSQLGSEVAKLVFEMVDKDITHASPEEIDAALRPHF